MTMRSKQLALLALLCGMLLGTTGCRYMANRYFDLRDMAAAGVGVSTESSEGGVWPPSMGVYLEATDWLHLGAIRHVGYVAELDMRGTGAYWEDRARLGFLCWQAVHLDQDYLVSSKNYFKTPGNLWEEWMRGPLMSRCSVPAKDLTYDHWIEEMQYGPRLRPRGWQYWEYIGGEVAVSEPFLTHWGLTLRLGLDPSEFSDFLLGWFGIDFKHDDLTQRMFDDMLGVAPVKTVEAAPVAAPANDEMARLREENARLADEVARLKGRLKECEEGGIEIELPEKVLFDTGSARLRDTGKSLLDRIAQQVKSQYPGYRVSVEGHTDSRPVRVHKSQFKTNWELGSARALAVVHYLQNQAGVSSYSATTYADNKPVDTNATAEGRQHNRRSVIVLKAEKDMPKRTQAPAVPEIK